MNKKALLITVVLAIGGLVYLYLRKKKNNPVNVISQPAGAISVKDAVVPAPVKQHDPVIRSTVVIPPIPKKYADGSAVPKSVLEDPEYIKAWNTFYQNTIFPPGDPRNTLTPSGGVLIGDGKGGFYDPNA